MLYKFLEGEHMKYKIKNFGSVWGGWRIMQETFFVKKGMI